MSSKFGPNGAGRYPIVPYWHFCTIRPGLSRGTIVVATQSCFLLEIRSRSCAKEFKRISTYHVTVVVVHVSRGDMLCYPLKLSQMATEQCVPVRIRYEISYLKSKNNLWQARNHQPTTTWLAVNIFNTESNYCPTACIGVKLHPYTSRLVLNTLDKWCVYFSFTKKTSTKRQYRSILTASNQDLNAWLCVPGPNRLRPREFWRASPLHQLMADIYTILKF